MVLIVARGWLAGWLAVENMPSVFEYPSLAKVNENDAVPALARNRS